MEVFLWGARIGALHQDNTDKVPTFQYDRKFLRSGIELAPFMMPLSERVFSFPELADSVSFRGLPGLVADSLPDKFGNSVTNLWLQQKGRPKDSMTPLERLCYTGRRAMGALEFAPAEEVGGSDAQLDVTELTELASRILSDKERPTFDMDDVTVAQMLEIGSSVGGARAKAVIAWNEQTGEIRSGQMEAPSGFFHWLIKFDNVRGNGDHGESDRKQYTLIEYAYHLMARELGIDMSECRILKKDGMSHFLTRRFDRQGGKKVFVQSLSALGHYDYNAPRTCSYESYADCARKLGIGKSGMEEIFRRTVFNIIGMNCDDHVKNFSFTMDRQGRWELAPAYDLTFAYNPDNMWLREHQMTLNNKSNGIGDEDMLTFGKRIGLSDGFCKDTIRRTEETVGEWKSYAEECGINEKTMRAIDSVLKKRM